MVRFWEQSESISVISNSASLWWNDSWLKAVRMVEALSFTLEMRADSRALAWLKRSRIQLSHSLPLGSVTITGSHQILTWNTHWITLNMSREGLTALRSSQTHPLIKETSAFSSVSCSVPPRPSPPQQSSHRSAQGPEKMSEPPVVLNPPRENAASFSVSQDFGSPYSGI